MKKLLLTVGFLRTTVTDALLMMTLAGNTNLGPIFCSVFIGLLVRAVFTLVYSL